LLSNIYPGGGNSHLHKNVEQQRKERGVKKQPGHTWIEVSSEVPMIVVDDLVAVNFLQERNTRIMV